MSNDSQKVCDQMIAVQGKSISIGAGFEAISFSHFMFGGAMDPLIMVDHFTMTNPTFGPHAHAGLSAVSILFEDSEGVFNNKDSLGNDINLMPGDLYWLKAGKGAVHDEKPGFGARTHALQIFVNLPANMKYDAPDSLHVKSADMPELVGDRYRVRLVLGESGELKGAKSPALPMTILDGKLEEGANFAHTVPLGQSAWILSVDGAFDIKNGNAVISLNSGRSVPIRAQDEAQDLIIAAKAKAHFVILQARPLRERFVQRGPFAMSTENEVDAMFAAHAAGKLGSLERPISFQSSVSTNHKECIMTTTHFNPEPLTPDNAALVLIDHQVGLMTGIRDYSIAELKHNVVGLAKAASALDIPIVTTTTSAETLWGPAFPELQAALPDHTFIDRTTVNAWDDPRVEAAIRETGRKKLIFAGISLEVCAAFPAMRAVREGYEAYVAVDASGNFNSTKRETGMARLVQSGVVIADGASLMIEILADNASPKAMDVYSALSMDWSILVGQVRASAIEQANSR